MNNCLLTVFLTPNCRYCPEAYNIINDITEKYPDIFLIPIRAEMSNPNNIADISDGQKYYNDLNITFLPVGVINMNLTNPLYLPQWESKIQEVLASDLPDSNIMMSADYINDTIHIKLKSEQNYKGKLMVWLLQNNVGIRQFSLGGLFEKKIYNNYFQKAMSTNLMGDDIELSDNIIREYSYDSNIKKDSNDLYILYFTYNKNGIGGIGKIKLND